MSSYLLATIGGVLIGVSSSLMLFFLGRITGISSIVDGCLKKVSKIETWKFYFLVGLFVGGAIMKIINPSFFSYNFNSSYILLITAGLLVGFGTRLGSGCTSGHGVCGLPRLSKRSIVATLTFMSSGILTVLIMRLFS